MKSAFRHFLRSELMEPIRDPYLSSWIGGMAMVAYILAFFLGILGGTTAHALVAFLAIGPTGFILVSLGRSGPARERSWRRLVSSYPIEPSQAFYGQLAGMASHAMLYLVLVAPGLSWYALMLPGSRPLILWGVLGYPFLAIGMVSAGIALSSLGGDRPMRWGGTFVVVFILALWVTLVSASGNPILHALLVLNPPVSQAHVLDAFPPLDSSRVMALGALFSASLFPLVIAARRYWRRSVGLTLLAIVVLSGAGFASSFGVSVDADERFNVYESGGDFGFRVMEAGASMPSGGFANPLPVHEPVHLTIQVRVDLEQDSSASLRLFGENLDVRDSHHVLRPTGDGPGDSRHEIDIVLELFPDLEVSKNIYRLYAQITTETGDKEAWTLIAGDYQEFKGGLGWASVASIVPFGVAIWRRRALN